MTQDRTLHLYGIINADTIAPIISEIIRINNEDEILYHQAQTEKISSIPRKPIHLYINSGGGEIYDALTGLSVIDSSVTPIYTYCHGYVMSAGLTLFVGGHKRFGGKHSQYMFHEPTINLVENILPTQEARVEEIKRIRDIRTKYICGRTDLTEQMFVANRYTDYFMDAQKALEYGVIHEII